MGREKTANAWGKDQMISTKPLSATALANEFIQRHGGRKGNFYTSIFYMLAKIERKHSPQSQDFNHSVILR